MRYPGNRLAHIQVSWLDPKKLREIVVVAERQMLVWDDLGSHGPITIYDKGIDRPSDYTDYGQFQLLTREGDITMPRVKLEEPLKAQNRFFLEAIRSRQLSYNGGVFAVDVLRVLKAIDQSLKSNGILVDVQ
jgi:predicted dehydrogenase